ncbi:MAG: RNA-directed DNA polymerase, partial [Flavobacterium sp.]
KKDTYLESYLFGISEKVNDKAYNLKLSHFFDPNTGKFIYTIQKNVSSYFVMKQLQFNLRKTFNVKPSDRHYIVKQLKSIMGDDFPKYIVRTDIKSFYESIPQYKLLKILSNNPLLSPQSFRFIKNLIYEYNIITNQVKIEADKRIGIPRGIGISAYLSELFMRDIDENIQRLNAVSYYARYVDDIIIIFTPPYKKDDKNYFLNLVEKIIEDEGLKINIKSDDGFVNKFKHLLGGTNNNEEKLFQVAKLLLQCEQILSFQTHHYLKLIQQQVYSVSVDVNSRIDEIDRIVSSEIKSIENNKTFQCNLFKSSNNFSINFLGYKFVLRNGRFSEILLSDKKMEKYQARMKLTFQAFSASRRYNYAESRKLLHSRLSYLTKNTRLTMPKKDFIGIYYSNNLINESCSSLKELNSMLYDIIDQNLPDPKDEQLRVRLKRFCFIDGFSKRTFYNLTSKVLPKIKDKSGSYLRTNFEKIVYIWE